jgi:hypothetical protein
MFTSTQLATANVAQLRVFAREVQVAYKGVPHTDLRVALAPFAASDSEVQDVALVAPEVVQSDIDQGMVDAGIEVPHEPRIFTPEEAPLVPVPTAEVPAPVVQNPNRATSKGVKIQKDRPTQNGVKMPSEGTLCRAVWDYLQAEADHGRTPTAKSVKEYAPTVGWNPNNASIEFYNWRKFNGVSGRAPK